MKIVTKPLGIIALIAVIGFSMAACKEPADDEPPVLTGMVSINGNAQVGETLTADTTALGGNGTITYQWKRGTAKIGTNDNTYVVQSDDLDSAITVTVTRKGYSGSVTSDPTAVVTNKTPPSGIVIDLAGMNEWELTALTAQATPNVDKIFTVTGTYATYRWFLDGVSDGTSSSYTFNKPSGVYQLVVVVSNDNGESRSGRCRVTVGN